MKKRLLFLCVLFLMFALVGCGQTDEQTLNNYLDKITVVTEVEGDFHLPYNVDNKDDHSISWTSSDANIIRIGNIAEQNGIKTYTAKVTRSADDKTVTLTATVELASGSKATKDFTVTVKKDDKIVNPDPKPQFDTWPYEENKPYKFTLVHTKLNKTYYFTGNMDGFYLATTEKADKAVDVYCEKVDGGYKLFFTKDGVKNYFAIEMSADGKHTNAKFGADKNCVFTWDKSLQTMVTKIGDEIAFFGTSSEKEFTTIGGTKNTKPGAQCPVTLTVSDGKPIEPDPKPTPQPDEGWGVLNTFEAGKAYKFGLLQTNKDNQVIYLSGKLNEKTPWYLLTTTDKNAAADVTAVAVEGGYNIKVEGADGVKYINAKKDGTHYSIFLEDAAASVWTWDEAHKTFITTCVDKQVFIGTYQTFTTLSANTIDKFETNMVAHFYGENGEKPVEPDPKPTPQPDEGWGVLNTFEAGKAYKFGLLQTNKDNQVIYLSGKLNEKNPWYLLTTTDKNAAANVTAVAVDGGYNIKVEGESGVKYINAKKDGTHYSIFLEDAAASVWTWDEAHKTFITTCVDKQVFVGTYQTYTTLSACTIDKFETNMVAHFYGDTTAQPVEPEKPTQPELGAWPYEVNKAYKFTMIHTNPAVNKTYYFTGNMSGFYFGTTTNAGKGVDVFCEQVEGGYKLYFMDGETKNYLGIVKSADGEHINAVFGADVATVFNWEKNLNTMVTVLDNETYYFGTDAEKTYGTIGTRQFGKPGSSCVVTLTNPEIVPEVEVKEDLLTTTTLGIEGQPYGKGTATINGVNYEFTEIADYGNGIQMRTSKSGVSTEIKNTSALANAIKEVKFNLNKTSKDINAALTIKFTDETGKVLETKTLDIVNGTLEYTITSTANAKFMVISHTCKNAVYVNSIAINPVQK